MRFQTVREGVITGVIGATAVAVWFFVVDLVSGQPFHTPATLGEAVSAVFGSTEGESALRHVAMYTLFHYAVFAVMGTIAASGGFRNRRKNSSSSTASTGSPRWNSSSARIPMMQKTSRCPA